MVEIKSIEKTESCIRELTNLLRECVESGSSVGFLAPAQNETLENYWAEVQKDIIKGEKILLALYFENRLAGTVILSETGKINGRHRISLEKLMVHEAQRGKGFGRKLIEEAENKALELDKTLILLDTRKGDTAEKLYRKMGYTEYGEVPDYALGSDREYHPTLFFYKQI